MTSLPLGGEALKLVVVPPCLECGEVGKLRSHHDLSAAGVRAVTAKRDDPGHCKQLGHNPDGLGAASGSRDHTVHLWGIATDQASHILRGHTNEVYVVAFSPDGRTTASRGQDTAVRLWDVASGRCRAILAGHGGSVVALACRGDERRVQP